MFLYQVQDLDWFCLSTLCIDLSDAPVGCKLADLCLSHLSQYNV